MHHEVWELIYNRPLIAAIIAQQSSQFIKVFYPLFKGKAPDFKEYLNYGGMPSAHTAFIIAGTVGAGLAEGFSSTVFAVAAVCAGIIIYDLIKLRTALERSLDMNRRLFEEHSMSYDKKVPQFRGHSSAEVVAGALWGLIWAVLIARFWPLSMT